MKNVGWREEAKKSEDKAGERKKMKGLMKTEDRSLFRQPLPPRPAD